ncbi:MAG: MauE/DoxX family redox-associated membrane protein [Rhodanobacter sp.]
MISVLLPIILLLAVMQKHLDRDFFFSWIEENFRSLNGKFIYFVIQLTEVMALVYLVIAKQDLAKLVLSTVFISSSIAIQLVIRWRRSKNCPCFGTLSGEGRTNPLVIYISLLCVALIDLVIYSKSGGSGYAAISRTVEILFVTILLLSAFNGQRVRRRVMNDLRRTGVSGLQAMFGNDLDPEVNRTSGEVMVLFMSRQCTLCRTAATVIVHLQSLWKHKVYCAIKGYTLSEESEVVTLEGLQLISCNGGDCFSKFNVKKTPSLMYANDNDVFVYQGLADVIYGFVEMCFKESA